ncbi:tetratricopeptide repeat protein [Jannaschia sp. W003]|uniref:tetratricopeptide repeat protein n=1 Tax=Jannaschia sp. W003 TaxID=2867012 RepID=UPI0021A71270|nr:tetratricopeptide repeat protein [Jannaschia sp. W003]UWQ22914.1 tetratricopeptide repeat protein [Jannaschia sp. W003]
MPRRALPLLLGTLLLAACQPGGPVGRAATGDLLAPPGADASAAGVDPALVGDRLMAAGEFDLAHASYTRAAATGPAGLTPALMRSMAGADLAMGRLGAAEALLRDAVEADPGDAAAWNDLGVVLMERGEAGEAAESFRRAFALDPDRPQILDNLRLALDRREALRYALQDEGEDAFTLTRRRDGVYRIDVAQ